METAVIALGSNLGNRLEALKKAGAFLEKLSDGSIKKASIWESEPVGGAKFAFYNTAAEIQTKLPPDKLLHELKNFEHQCGREKNPVRWGPRILDMDIILYGNLVIQNDTLIIPHQEYKNRLFVLLPLFEINSSFKDPQTNMGIEDIINVAPSIEIYKTDYAW